MTVSFISVGNLSTQRKPQTCHILNEFTVNNHYVFCTHYYTRHIHAEFLVDIRQSNSPVGLMGGVRSKVKLANSGIYTNVLYKLIQSRYLIKFCCKYLEQGILFNLLILVKSVPFCCHVSISIQV